MALGTVGALVAGSAVSSVVGAVGSNKAAKAQQNAADASTALQREIYYQNRADGSQYRATGGRALAALARSAGVGVNQGQRFREFQESPGYQFQVNQGNQAIERGMAARGLRASGSTLKALANYNQGLASQEFGNYQNRLAGLAGVGQSQLSRDQQGGQVFANAAGMNNMAAGQARASGYQGVANAFNSGMNNVFGIYGAKQAGYFE